MLAASLRRLSALALILLWAGQSAAAEGPSAVVARLNGTLLEVMKQARELGYRGRYDLLAPVLRETFDFPRMTRLSVSRHWKSLGEAERERLTELFARLSIATYATRFDGHDGETFEVTGEVPARRDSILVRNRLVKASGEVVSLDYLLRKEAGRWLIIDVLLDGKISELALRRSEYTAVLSREGFDGLVGALEDKVASLAEAPGG